MILPCSGAHEACATCVEQLKDVQTAQFDCPHCREPVEGRINVNRGMMAALEARPHRVLRQRPRRNRRPAHQPPTNAPPVPRGVWLGRIAMMLVALIATLLIRRYALGPLPSSISEVTLTLTSGVGHFTNGVSATYNFDLRHAERVTYHGLEGVFLPFPGVRAFMLSIVSINWNNESERALIPPDCSDPSDHMAKLMSAVLWTTVGARCVEALLEQAEDEENWLSFGGGNDDNGDPYYFELEQHYIHGDARLLFYVDTDYADGLIMTIATKLKFDRPGTMYREARNVLDLPWAPCLRRR